MPLLRNNLVMKAGVHCWIWVQRCPNVGFLQGVRAGCAEKRLVSRKEQCLCSVFLETTTSFGCCGFGWIRAGGPGVDPCGVIVKLCVCVFPQETFPSYTQVNSELSKHFSSALHPGCTLPDSFLNSAIPQVWLIFILLRWRWCWEKWPKVLTSSMEKPNWEPWGGPSVTALDPWPELTTQLWNPSHGTRGSLHLRLCLEVLAAPETQILPIIISWAQWSWNPGQE